jgi:hypothetical protein
MRPRCTANGGLRDKDMPVHATCPFQEGPDDLCVCVQERERGGEGERVRREGQREGERRKRGEERRRGDVQIASAQ